MALLSHKTGRSVFNPGRNDNAYVSTKKSRFMRFRRSQFLKYISLAICLYTLYRFLYSERWQEIEHQVSDIYAHAKSTPLNVTKLKEPAPGKFRAKHLSNELGPWDDWAVALKTGASVSASRVSIQMLTFMRNFKNIMYIADVNHTIGETFVRGVVPETYLPSDLASESGGGKQENDQLVPDNDSAGWKLDAHKNLPGFKLLYEKYPDKEWYIMLDDDTYLLPMNLKNALRGKNPDKEWYLGAPNVFVGCDGVKEFGGGPEFAHGGTGIFISRGAMKKMYGIVDTCIEKYQDCWAGDVRVSLISSPKSSLIW